MNEESGKIEYHYGFYAATHAEYHAFREVLDFLQEQELGVEPVRLDMLIIKRDGPNPLKDAIGSFFRKYNILEYKSPEDGLTIDDFYKAQAYACLYKSMGKTVNSIPGDTLTVSIFRHTFPRDMFTALEDTGLEVAEPHPGVFHIEGALTVPAQVIVTSRLPAGEYAAFKVLARDATREDIVQFMTERDAYNREDVRAILRVSIAANRDIYRKLKEEGPMDEAFESVFHEELTAARNDGIAIGEERGEERGRRDGIAIGEERGEERGRREGILKTLAGLIRDGILTIRDAASRAGLTEDEFTAQMTALGY